MVNSLLISCGERGNVDQRLACACRYGGVGVRLKDEGLAVDGQLVAVCKDCGVKGEGLVCARAVNSYHGVGDIYGRGVYITNLV